MTTVVMVTWKYINVKPWQRSPIELSSTCAHYRRRQKTKGDSFSLPSSCGFQTFTPSTFPVREAFVFLGFLCVKSPPPLPQHTHMHTAAFNGLKGFFWVFVQTNLLRQYTSPFLNLFCESGWCSFHEVVINNYFMLNMYICSKQLHQTSEQCSLCCFADRERKRDRERERERDGREGERQLTDRQTDRVRKGKREKDGERGWRKRVREWESECESEWEGGREGGGVREGEREGGGVRERGRER